MGKVELIGKQANGRDAMLAFTTENYPKTVDEWIVAATKAGINFDEAVTREKGVNIGQFSSSGGYVKAGDTLEEYVQAQELIAAVAKAGKITNLYAVGMALTLAKHELEYTTEQWRKAEVSVSGPHGNSRDAYMKSCYADLPKELENAVDWGKVALPQTRGKVTHLVALPADKSLWLITVKS